MNPIAHFSSFFRCRLFVVGLALGGLVAPLGAAPNTPAKNILAPNDLILQLKSTAPGAPSVVGGDSSDNEQAINVIDGSINTKYFNKTPLGAGAPGIGTGFVVAPGVGGSVLTGIRFATANDMPDRDPLVVTLEGSNDFKSDEAGSGHFSLIYQGSTGLKADLERGRWGQTVRFDNTTAYKVYRVLVAKTRAERSDGTQYSEVELLGMPTDPNSPRIQYAQPALSRTHIDDKWADRAAVTITAPVTMPSPRSLWYRQPAKAWEEALPIGNGRLGAMIFGGVADERLQLNEDSLWDGYITDVANPAALVALPEVQRLLFAGKNKEAEKLAAATMLGKPSGVKPYQSLGELWMEFLGMTTASDYQRSLDLNTAVSGVSYVHDGTAFKRELFSSHSSGIIAAHLTASRPKSITFRLSLKRQKDAQCFAHAANPNAIVLRGQIDRKDETGQQRGMKFEAEVLVVAEGGTVSNAGGILNVTGADSVTLFVDGGPAITATTRRSFVTPVWLPFPAKASRR